MISFAAMQLILFGNLIPKKPKPPEAPYKVERPKEVQLELDLGPTK